MITYTELEKIAALAKLSLAGEDKEALLQDIGSILDFANEIAAAEAAQEERESSSDKALRADIVHTSLPAEEILANAGEQCDGYYVARRRGGSVHE